MRDDVVEPGAGRVLPLTFGQADRWRAEGDHLNPIATLALGFLVTGSLDRDRLMRAMHLLTRRHPALTARLRRAAGGPVQVIGATSAEQLDVRSAGAATLDDATRRTGDVALRLSDEHLFRVRLFDIEPDCHVVAVNVHHAVWDAVSDGIFARELWSLYEGIALPPLSASYDQVVERQGAWIEAHGAARLQTWSERLTRLPPPPALPRATPRTQVTSFRGDTISRSFPWEGSRFERARAACGSGGAAGLATLAIALRHLTGAPEVALGVLLSDRLLYQAREQIGLFINTVPVRFADLDQYDDLEPAAAVDALRLIADAYRWMLPRFMLAQELIPGRAMAPYDITFNFISDQGVPAVRRIGALEIARLEIPRAPSCLTQASEVWDGDNLWVNLSTDDERVAVDLLYNERFVSTDEATRLVTLMCDVAT